MQSLLRFAFTGAMQDGFMPEFRDDGAVAREKSSFTLSLSAAFRRKGARKIGVAMDKIFDRCQTDFFADLHRERRARTLMNTPDRSVAQARLKPQASLL